MNDPKKLRAVFNNASFLDDDYRDSLNNHFERSLGDTSSKLQNFARYVPRQSLTRFLVKYELFKKILNTQGSIFEVGVLAGGSLFSWAQCSAIFEHLNYQRKIVGFDVFGKQVTPNDDDRRGNSMEQYFSDEMMLDSQKDIEESIALFDRNRFLGDEQKIFLVDGLAEETIPEYLEQNPETVISLLYLDVNLYEPTKAALQHCLPRMPKGSLIVFDELNDRGMPGETKAVIDTIGLANLRIQRFSWDTKISYAIL